MSESRQVLYTVYDDRPSREAAVVDSGLESFNTAAAPLQDVVPLSCFARLPPGDVIGGAVGRTWGDCCELQQLWVESGHRGQGIGTHLVRMFERRAESLGCRTFYLETFSFQAPQLYCSLGYEVKLELRGFPDDIVKYIMVREVPRHR